MKLRLICRAVMAAAAIIVWNSCATPVHVEKDTQVDLSRYKTFAWITGSDGKKIKGNDLEDRNVHAAVASELTRAGLREVSNDPDLLVSYDVLIEKGKRVESNPIYSPAASRLYFNPYARHYGTIFYPTQFWGYNDYVVPVREGTITITMTDGKTDKTVWQAWSTEEVNSRRLSRKEIKGRVHTILRKFQPARK